MVVQTQIIRVSGQQKIIFFKLSLHAVYRIYANLFFVFTKLTFFSFSLTAAVAFGKEPIFIIDFFVRFQFFLEKSYIIIGNINHQFPIFTRIIFFHLTTLILLLKMISDIPAYQISIVWERSFEQNGIGLKLHKSVPINII